MASLDAKTTDWYAELAKRAAERSLYLMADEDVSAELSLAVAAWSVVMGEASDGVRSDLDEFELTDEGGYEIRSYAVCICPPELLARDGFRGGCPVHAGV